MTVWTPYCGPAPEAGDWRWNLDPILILILGAAAPFFGFRSQGRERLFGLAAVAVLAVSFVSPLCALSSALFTARTIHHVLVAAVAAPLLAFALPRPMRGSAAAAVIVQAGVLWGWHAPGAYAWALSNDAAYWLMQAMLLGSSVWFWSVLRRLPAPATAACLLVAMVAMGLLGALLTFASRALYEPHALTTAAWGLSPLEDQQLAGLIMWAPAAAIYLAAALLTLGRWIGPDARPEAGPA